MNLLRLTTWAAIALLAVLCLNACKEKEETEPVSPITKPDTAQVFAVEDAYPGVECVWQNGTLFGQPIRYGIINGRAIFEGDIILTPEQLAPQESPNGRIEGAGVQTKTLRWRNFTVPYTIDPNLQKQFRVTDAIAHWEEKTPLRFVLRTNEPDYIKFTTGSGCSSELGRTKGEQLIELATCTSTSPSPCGECSTGSVIHEIGHAVGLLHEQTRSDRDDFVTIHENNIPKNDRDQFIKYTDDAEINGFKFGNYDFNSVMHYAWNAFAIDKTKPTITRNDGGGNLTFGQRNELSSRDRQTVIAMYSNLYIIDGNDTHGSLWTVCLKDGRFALANNGGWEGFVSKTMAEDDLYLWTIKGETLYRVHRFNGSRKSFGTGWNGALGVTSIVNPSTLWAIKGKDLYAITKDGVRKDVDNFDWSNSKAIFAHKDFLFIVDGKGTLWKSDMNTGKWHNLGGGWGGTSFIAAASTNSQDIYITEGNSLWRVNENNGNYTKIGPSHWSNVKGMVGIAGKLYLVDEGILYEVDENGNRRSLGGGWSSTKSMGIIRNANVL